MRIGIHQINYFPWLGYFNKVAKSDKFILMDEVQLTDSGPMQRNKVLNKSGEPTYLTVAFDKKNYMEKTFSEIMLNSQVDWQKRQKSFLMDAYHKFPYWNEVWAQIEPVFTERFNTLMEVNMCALQRCLELLEIDTTLIYQSQLDYDKTAKKNELVLELCKAAGGHIYLSGTGAKKYMDLYPFEAENIKVQFQTYCQPTYTQKYANDFVSGMSILDMLLNCGIDRTKKLFWDNMCEEEISL